MKRCTKCESVKPLDEGEAMTTLSELRRLAKAATPGPFVVIEMGDEDDGIMRTINTFAERIGREVAIMTTGDFPDHQEEKNADYIAALSPERVLALLDVIEAAKAMRSQMDQVPPTVMERNLLHSFDAALARLEQEG